MTATSNILTPEKDLAYSPPAPLKLPMVILLTKPRRLMIDCCFFPRGNIWNIEFELITSVSISLRNTPLLK